MQVLHYRPGEPRTPAVAISLSGFGGSITARGHRERRPQHDTPTEHDPTHHHLTRVCWCEGTLPQDTNSHPTRPVSPLIPGKIGS
jgi:hypothetical protein